MSFDLPPAVKAAESVLKAIEQAVRRFARYHKYTHGTVLREQAMKIAQLAHRACRDPNRRTEWLDALVWQIDDFNLSLQLGQQIKAFASLAEFEAIARLVKDLGRQVGGWRKEQQRKQHAKGQNAASPFASQQRAQILSTRGASTYEAHP